MKYSLIAIAAGSLLFSDCGRHAEPSVTVPPLPTAKVSVQTVQNKSFPAVEEVVGTVRCKLRAGIEAKVSGRILKLPVRASQVVKAGDLLVELDAREIQARLDQALAVREQADRELKRAATLLRGSAMTQQEYDTIEARFLVAQASVKEAETTLSYTRITAPFGGIITRKPVDVGDLASPGRTLLELEDPNQLRFEADVSEVFIDKIKPDDRLTVKVSAQSKPLQVPVTEMDPVADPASRTFRVKLDLPPSPELRAGLFGRVEVPVGVSQSPRVPESAVVARGQMEIVFVVENQQAHLRLVKTGKRVDGEVELLAGVVAGEKIVVKGAPQLTDGQPLQIE